MSEIKNLSKLKYLINKSQKEDLEEKASWYRTNKNISFKVLNIVDDIPLVSIRQGYNDAESYLTIKELVDCTKELFLKTASLEVHVRPLPSQVKKESK
ncbi:MAG: hypothetical protein FH748_05345 [Balneolaceae bacterium]|nr:hypothetical protein [Balneolaceae bacterium]